MVPTLSSAEPAEAAVTYREQAPPPALAPWVRCLWELTVQGGGAGRVVPDGFMDLVASGPVVTWSFGGGPLPPEAPHNPGRPCHPSLVPRRSAARLAAMVAALGDRLDGAEPPDPLVAEAPATSSVPPAS